MTNIASWQEVWNYLTNNQDEPNSKIAERFQTTDVQMIRLTVWWAIGNPVRFQSLFSEIKGGGVTP